MAAIILGAFALGIFLAACDTEGDQWTEHPMMATDDQNYAKNMSEDNRCDVDNLFIEDCADACTCCNWGESEVIGECIVVCNDILVRFQNYPPAHTDIDNYKECIVGCWSICDKPYKEYTCWEECKKYVGGAD